MGTAHPHPLLVVCPGRLARLGRVALRVIRPLALNVSFNRSSVAGRPTDAHRNRQVSPYRSFIALPQVFITRSQCRSSGYADVRFRGRVMSEAFGYGVHLVGTSAAHREQRQGKSGEDRQGTPSTLVAARGTDEPKTPRHQGRPRLSRHADRLLFRHPRLCPGAFVARVRH